MPRYGKYQITGMRDFRIGGMATLSTGRMVDGAEIVVRELQEQLVFKWQMRRKFSIGLKIRKKIPPHPNLVWSMGTGWKGFTPFEIMPFVNGTSLQSQLIQDREYVLQHAIGLLLQSAEGIKHVHASGFLHLDVKAGNILLDLTDRENPEAKITDFDLSMPRRWDMSIAMSSPVWETKPSNKRPRVMASRTSSLTASIILAEGRV